MHDFNEWYAKQMIRMRWPAALDIMGPEKCPVCDRCDYWSFTTKELKAISPAGAYQSCGYVCLICRVERAGVRDISQMMIAPAGGGEQ